MFNKIQFNWTKLINSKAFVLYAVNFVAKKKQMLGMSMSEKVEMLQCRNKKNSNSISKSFDFNKKQKKKYSKWLFHWLELKCQIFLLFEVCNLIFASLMMHISYSRAKVCMKCNWLSEMNTALSVQMRNAFLVFDLFFLFVQLTRRDKTHKF